MSGHLDDPAQGLLRDLPDEIRLLLALERTEQLPALVSGVKWEPTLVLARQHRVDGLLVNTLRQVGLLPRSRPVAGAVQRAIERARTFRTRVVPQLVDLISSLRAAGIDAALLKGASLLVTGRLHPLERPLGDLDVLVPEDAWLAAAEALQRRGYWYRRPQDLAYARTHHYQLPALYHDEHPLAVELHRHILTPRHRLRFAVPELSTSPVVLPDGTPTRRLDDADELAHLALHFWGDRAAGRGAALGQLYDIRRLRRSISAASLQLAGYRAAARGYPGVLACCLALDDLLLSGADATAAATADGQMLQRFAVERVLQPRDPALQFLMVSADVDYTAWRVAKRAASRLGQYRRNDGAPVGAPSPWQVTARLAVMAVRQPLSLFRGIRLDRWAQTVR